MRGATCVIVQTHQILRLPRKVTLIIDPLHTWNVIYNARSNKCHCPKAPKILRLPRKVTLIIDPLHTWNVIYNARSNKCHCPNSPNTAPATKWISWLILDTNETLFTMRGATCVIVQTHQILRLPRKMTVQNLKEICWKRMKRHFQCAADPSMIRAWSDHETVSPQPASQPRLPFTPTTNILYWKIQHFALRLSFQISPNTAPATKSDTCTSPNTAPATKSKTHHWSSSHMKRYLQCAE